MFTTALPRPRSAHHRGEPRRRPRERGFTILEVAVAAGILTLVIGTSLAVLARGFASLDTARCLSYASQILQSEMEKMRLEKWGDGTTAGTGSTATGGVSSYSTSATTINFMSSDSWSWSGDARDIAKRMTLTRTASDVHTDMIKVTFTISWKSHDGHPIQRSYTTYYAKNGLYDYFSS